MSSAFRLRWRRGLSRALGVLAVLCAVLWVRALAEARTLLSTAARAEAAGEDEARRDALARALRWQAPFNPYADDALEQLTALAAEAQARGERVRALRLWRSVRGSLSAAGGLWQPRADALAAADAEIAALLRGRAGAGQGTAGSWQGHREPPSPLVRALSLSAFAAWVGAAFALSCWGFEADGRLRRGPAGAALLVVGLALGLWCAGLWWASS